MKRAASILLLLALTACASTAPCVPSVQTVTVKVPVAVACVDLKDIPAEPSPVTITGDARNDSALLGSKVADLRVWGRQMVGMLGACAKP